MIPFIPTAGDQLTMTCNITVPERLVHEPSSVVWSYDQAGQQRIDVLNTNAAVSSTVRIGDSFFSNLTLNPVVTSDVRRYYCIITFQPLDTSDFTFRELTVRSKFSYY